MGRKSSPRRVAVPGFPDAAHFWHTNLTHSRRSGESRLPVVRSRFKDWPTAFIKPQSRATRKPLSASQPELLKSVFNKQLILECRMLHNPAQCIG
jgi:hypothetical protein